METNFVIIKMYCLDKGRN